MLHKSKVVYFFKSELLIRERSALVLYSITYKSTRSYNYQPLDKNKRVKLIKLPKYCKAMIIKEIHMSQLFLCHLDKDLVDYLGLLEGPGPLLKLLGGASDHPAPQFHLSCCLILE